jgi:hypothetical protein
MQGRNPHIAMTDVAVLVPDTEIEVSLYTAVCHGLAQREELDLEQRAALAMAVDAFRAAYQAAGSKGRFS